MDCFNFLVKTKRDKTKEDESNETCRHNQNHDWLLRNAHLELSFALQRMRPLVILVLMSGLIGGQESQCGVDSWLLLCRNAERHQDRKGRVNKQQESGKRENVKRISEKYTACWASWAECMPDWHHSLILNSSWVYVVFLFVLVFLN